MSEALQGLEQAIQTIDAIPNAATFEFADMMGRLGRDILAVQRDRVAKDTRNLEAGLSSQLHVDGARIRLRVGLLGVEAMSKDAQRRAKKDGRSDPRNLGDIYYGRFVEFGRHAQTVLVQRRRRVDGMLRTLRRRKHPDDVFPSYKMDVRAMSARPYVNVGDDTVDQLVAARTQSFWDRVLDHAGAA